MILRRLRLKNYRNYRSLEIEFPTGLIGVVGRNGVGKTTLLEAIAFALYGSEASRTKAKGLRRDGAGNEETCEVELEFSLGGEPYRIIRWLKGANEAQQAVMYHRSNSEPMATQPSGVQATVRKLVGMDYATFSRSLFSKQKEVNALSDARPEERRRAIRRMIGIDTITRARDAAKTERNAKEAEVQGARRALEALPSKRAEVQELEPQVKAARASVSVTARRASSAARVVNALRTKIERLEKKRLAHAEFENEASGLRGDLRGAEKRKQKLRDEITSLRQAKAELSELLPQEHLFKRVRRLKETLDRASGKYEERVELEEEVGRLSARAGTAKTEAEEAHRAVAKLLGTARTERAAHSAERRARVELARHQKARGIAQRELGHAESQAKRVKTALAEVQRIGPKGRCPTCYRQLGDSFEEITTHLRIELDQHAAAVAAARRRIKSIDSAIQTTNGHIVARVQQVQAAAKDATKAARAKEKSTAAKQTLATVMKTLREKRARLKTLSKLGYEEGKHREIQKQFDGLSPVHDKVEGLRHEVERLPVVQRELGSTGREANLLGRRIAVVERRRASLRFDPAEYASKRNACDSAQMADKAAALAHSKAKGELSKHQEALRRLNGEIRHLEKLRAQIAGDEEAVQYLSRIEVLLDGFRNDLINRVRPQIEEYASPLFDQMTDGRYPRIILDEEYNISIHDGFGVYPIRRFSGGEEDLANLCLRIAISQVVAQRSGADTSSLVVLDEVFGSQDVERRERILQALGRLQETFQQIVVITHTEDIQDRVPNLLHITENAAREAVVAWT